MPRKEGMQPIHILVSEADRERIKHFAKAHGYKGISDYIRHLIEQNMNEAGETIDLEVDRGGWRGGTSTGNSNTK